VSEQAGRALRADAKENEDRLLAAASAALARDGDQVSLKAIAQQAGVGIGTLYRRFPTRDELVWAVYRRDVDRICAAAPKLLKSAPPDEALRQWMTRFVDFLIAKGGMASALKAALTGDDDQRLAIRARITDAVVILLDAGAAAGTLRRNANATDIMMALGGTALVAGDPDQRDQAERLLDLLMAGLRRSSD
jgi:AcrR family transcriptional regulator